MLTCVRSNAQAPLFHLATLFRRNSSLPFLLPYLGAPRQGRATNLPIIQIHYKAPVQERFMVTGELRTGCQFQMARWQCAAPYHRSAPPHRRAAPNKCASRHHQCSVGVPRVLCGPTRVRPESARDESDASKGNESLTSSTMPTRGNMSVLRVRGSGDSPYSQAYNLHYRGTQSVNRARSASPIGRSQAHRAGQVHSQPLHHQLQNRARLETPINTTTRQQEAEGRRSLYGEPPQPVTIQTGLPHLHLI